MERDLALRVAERYANGSRAVRGYVAGKLRADPVVARVVEIGRARGFGRVLDLGCGRGQLAVALLEARAATSVRGFDWDEEKIAAARAASKGLDATFERGDLRTHDLGAFDTALLIDVLHYLPADDQRALLLRAVAARPRAMLVRELDPDRGWRSAVTRLQEAITTGFGYNAGERLEYLPIAEIARPLERAGYEVAIEPAWGSTPFSNVLVVAVRSASSP